MKSTRGPLSFALVTALVLGAAAAQSRAFRDEVRAAGAAYESITESNLALLREGKVAESTRRLLDAVPEKERTAAHCFVLGNMLYTIDIPTSYELHRRAAEMAPAETPVLFEWAMQRHRKGEIAEAVTIYTRLLEGAKRNERPRLQVLRADCQLRLRHFAEAVADWEEADPNENGHELESALAWIHCGTHPVSQRGDLLAKLRSGKRDVIEDLILLDLHWQTDWWNARPNQEYLDADLAEVRTLLDKDSPRLGALELLARFTPKDELDAVGGDQKEDAAALAEAATRLGVLGEHVALPTHTTIASKVLRRVIDGHAATAEELRKRFEPELRQRLEKGDAIALETLCALHELAGDEDGTKALEAVGWERFGHVDCIAALLLRNVDSVAPDDPRLVAALAKAPNDERLAEVRARIALRTGTGAVPAIARLLELRLAHLVEIGPTNSLFALLKQNLDDGKKK